MLTILRKFIPCFLLDWYHLSLAFLSAVFYRFPSRKLIVIGVTGTAGKSTVIEFIHQIFKEAGNETASLSSIGFKINEKEEINRFKMTMPGRGYIQKFLRKAVDAECKYAIIETTSEGILQHRHKFINFNTAVFTNLSPEHIERHGSFEKYQEAKGRLFQATKGIHIVNIDDEHSDYFLKFPAQRKITFGLNQGEVNQKKLQLKLKIPGEFNIYNSLAAVCVGLSQGVDLEICKKALEKIKGIPGRMEFVVKKPFSVIVDYAHTPDELEKVYKTIKCSLFHVPCSMICVLGACGGGRDKWKRPELGKIAAKYCDEIILTNEDPYDEDPEKILDEIESGINKKDCQKILDRREAIKKALSLAKPGDTVIITGKGCEPWMCVANGKKIPWDDRQIVKQEFQKLERQV